MKKTMKKMLALVLVLVMCVSVAMPVFAADATCPGAGKEHMKDNCKATPVVGGKHDPSCQKQGYTVYQCDTCGDFFADDIVPSLGGVCDWEIDTEATCATPGKKHCKVCGAVEEIAATGKHNYVWDTEATCGVAGAVKTGICKVCGDKKVVSLDAHKYPSVPEITKKPTCAVDGAGEAVYKCENCNYEKKVVIYALDHHMDLVDLTKELKDATCGTAGLKLKAGETKAEKCTVCGYNTTEVVEAQHSWGAEYTLAPTCTTYGFVFKGCELCGTTETVKVIEKAGHNYVSSNSNATCGEDVTLTCDWSAYKCTNTACVVDGKHTLHPTTGCGATEELKGRECDYEEKTTPATCVEPGYKWEECKVCGNKKEAVQTTPATGVHTWNEEPEMNASTDPTCQHAGVYTYLCKNDGCLAFTQVPKAKLEHKLDGGDTTQPECGKDGYITYTCTQPGCNVNGKAYTEVVYPDSLKFDPANKNHHGDLAGSHIVPTVGEKNPVTGLPYPNTEATCGAASVTTYKCTICTAATPTITVKVNGVDTEVQPWVTFAVVGELKAHLGLTVTTPANLPDECGEVGVTEGWECSVCKKSVASVAVKASKTEHNMVITNTNKQLSCSNTLKYECDCVFDIVDEKGNVYIKDVACKAVDELKCEGIAKEPADERDNTCTVWGYQHFECPKCEQGYIDNFEYATGHNLVEDKTQYVAPDCTTDGKKVAICDVVHTDYDGTTYTCGHVETTVLEKLGHADKDGNVIPCTDADGKPITENVLCFRECCCTCEATVTECPGHLVSWKDLHDWVDTVVAATCVHYQYTLHVCEVCQYDYTTTTFIKGDHNYTGAYKTKVVNGKTEFVLDANGKKVPDVNYNNIPMGTVSKASWYIAKAEDKASYTKAGVMTFDCKNAGCKVSITEEYVLTDVNLTVSIDSAVKASAKLVNSGKMAVTIKANAYKVDLRSIYFELPYDTAKFTYSNAKIETTLFGDSGFAVGAKDGVVAVQMTNPGNIDNITLNGTDVALITLYFDIKNTVVQNDSVTDFSMNVKNTSVIKVENAKNVAVDSTIGKAAASKVYVLGNVTGGTIEAFAAKKYADDYDVVALIDILMAGKYDAVADMNKDGKVDAKDYAALGKYVVNAITYDDLCKTAK